MGGGRVWRDSVEVPHVSQCEDVSGYSADQINGWISQVKGAQTWNNLFTAANAWTAAGDALDGLKDRIHEVAGMLESAWSSDDSVAAQQALQHLHNTARDLATTSRDISSFTNSAAETLQSAVGNFDTGGGDDGPGFFERNMGNVGLTPVDRTVNSTVGGLIDGGVDFVGGLLSSGPSPDEKAREALTQLNAQYQADNTRLPQQVSAQLPVLADPEIGHTPMNPVAPITPPSPPNGTSVPDAPPTGFNPDSIPDTPDGPGADGTPTTPVPDGPGTDIPTVPGGPDAGGPGYDPNTGYDDGVTGGLAGTGGGFTSPGAGPGTGVSGGIGTGGGAGTGVSGGGIGAGGATGGGVGAGVAAVGGARGGGVGAGMVPMGGAGARGSGGAGGRAGAAGGRGAGTGGGAVRGPLAGGRAGAAGGMVPMGAGRGSGGKDDGRETWLVEDDDPWGTETETPPGVIR